MASGDSDLQWRFYLTSTATPQTEVIEPENWATFKSEFVRDRKAHGVWYRFTSEKILLGFAGPGRTILENEFQWYGFDGTVTFVAQKRQDEWSSWVTAFTGRALFTNREHDAQYFRCDFEDSGTSEFLSKIKNRFDVKVDLGATTDLDGNAISTTISKTLNHFNFLRQTSEYSVFHAVPADATAKTQITAAAESATPLVRYWWPEFVGAGVTDLSTYSDPNQPATIQSAAPILTDEIFTFGETGTATFTLAPAHYQILLDNICGADASPVIAAEWSWTLQHWRTSSVIATYDKDTAGLENWGVDATTITGGTSSCPTKNGIYDTGESSTTLTGVDIPVVSGDTFTFFLKMTLTDVANGGAVTSDYTVDFYDDSYFSIKLLTAAGTKLVWSYLLYDVLDRMVQIVTGQQNGVHSNFYKLTEHGAPTDGCGGLRLITNGHSLRGRDINTPQLSLKDILGSLSAIDNIGWGVEDNYLDEAWTLRVEPAEYFYADAEVVDIGTVDDFVASIDDDMVFNQVKVGYNKSAKGDDTLSSLDNDDFLTQSEYLMPLVHAKGTKTLLSTLIASGHLISTGLEESYEVGKTWRHDEDIFIIVVERSATPGRFIPENDENLDAISGVADSATIYNARIAPVFMFLAHSLFLNSATLGKNITTEKYRIQQQHINKTFSATISSAFACQDPEGLARSVSSDILIQNLGYGWRLFEPTIHTFQKAMTQSQIDTLVAQLTGDTISTNYGYITYTDEEGNIETGFPIKITYGVNEIAEFECIERSDAYLEQ